MTRKEETYPQCIARAFFAFTSWNILTLSEGDEWTFENRLRGVYAL